MKFKLLIYALWFIPEYNSFISMLCSVPILYLDILSTAQWSFENGKTDCLV